MRATVTINDEVFQAVDRLAEEWGCSRSKVYQRALEELLRVVRERALTARTNAFLEKHRLSADRGMEQYVAAAWHESMGSDEW